MDNITDEHMARVFEGQTGDEKCESIDDSASFYKHYNNSLLLNIDVERDEGADETDSFCLYRSSDMYRDEGEDETGGLYKHHNSSLSIGIDNGGVSQLSDDEDDKESYTRERLLIRRHLDETKVMTPYDTSEVQYKYRNNNIKSCDWCWKFRWYFAFLTLISVMVIALCLVALVLFKHHDDISLDDKDSLKNMSRKIEEISTTILTLQQKAEKQSRDISGLQRGDNQMQNDIKQIRDSVNSLQRQVQDIKNRINGGQNLGISSTFTVTMVVIGLMTKVIV